MCAPPPARPRPPIRRTRETSKIRRGDEGRLEVGDQVVVVASMGSGQRYILRCEAANTAASASTILAK